MKYRVYLITESAEIDRVVFVEKTTDDEAIAEARTLSSDAGSHAEVWKGALKIGSVTYQGPGGT